MLVVLLIAAPYAVIWAVVSVPDNCSLDMESSFAAARHVEAVRWKWVICCCH